MAYVMETLQTSRHATHGERVTAKQRAEREFDDAASRERAASLYSALSLLARCASLYTALHHAEASQETGLSATDVKALEMIAEFQNLTIGQLMHLTGLSAGGTTAVVDRLEHARLIARDRHQHDRRITVLRPLRAAWPAAIRRAIDERLDAEALGAELSSDECAAVCGFLERALDSLHLETERHLGEHGPMPDRR